MLHCFTTVHCSRALRQLWCLHDCSLSTVQFVQWVSSRLSASTEHAVLGCVLVLSIRGLQVTINDNKTTNAMDTDTKQAHEENQDSKNTPLKPANKKIKVGNTNALPCSNRYTALQEEEAKRPANQNTDVDSNRDKHNKKKNPANPIKKKRTTKQLINRQIQTWKLTCNSHKTCKEVVAVEEKSQNHHLHKETLPP